MRKRFGFAQLSAATRRSLAAGLGLVLITLGLSLSATAQEPTIITFDAPGAANGTFPNASTPRGP
jgi:hypothetical protein